MNNANVNEKLQAGRKSLLRKGFNHGFLHGERLEGIGLTAFGTHCGEYEARTGIAAKAYEELSGTPWKFNP